MSSSTLERPLFSLVSASKFLNLLEHSVQERYKLSIHRTLSPYLVAHFSQRRSMLSIVEIAAPSSIQALGSPAFPFLCGLKPQSQSAIASASTRAFY